MAGGVKHRIIISHIPFNSHYNPPFNIEEERYAYWCKLIKENIKPDFMLCGHIHTCKVMKLEDENTDTCRPCAVIAASKPFKGSENIVCGSIVVSDNSAKIKFVDSEGEIHGEDSISF